jgi:DNA-directed RNA polymerase specialized sigma24 family protein
MAAEIGAALHAAIAELPPAFQDVFLLSVVQGFSYQQIARTLDIPRGTVMSRLSRARQFLRQRLVPYLTDAPAHVQPPTCREEGAWVHTTTRPPAPGG